MRFFAILPKLQDAHRGAPAFPGERATLAPYCFAAMMCAQASIAQGESSVSLKIDKLEGAGFSAAKVAVRMDSVRSTLHAEAADLRISRHQFGRVTLDCGTWRNDGNIIECARATLKGKRLILGDFRYVVQPASLTLRGSVDAQSKFDLTWARKRKVRTANLALVNVDAQLLSPLLSAQDLAITGGRVDARAQWRADSTSQSTIAAEAAWRDGAFSDTAGLRAGEKIAFALRFNAAAQRDQWRFSAIADWKEGEVFWQPLYLRAGHTLNLTGTLTPDILALSKADVIVGRVGSVTGALRYDVKTQRISRVSIASDALNAEPLYDEWIKPFVEGKALGNLRVGGRVRVSGAMDEKGIEAARVRFDALSFEDKGGRFALFNASGDVPWQRGSRTEAQIEWEGAEFAKLPVGRVRAHAQLADSGVDFSAFELPLFDGKLAVRDFHVTMNPVSAVFEGRLDPISLPVLMSALGGPALQGTLSGTIPRVEYLNGDLRMDGSLTARVFDGDVVIKNVSGNDLFGRVPRFRADVEAKRLDLDLVTRAFSFGRITGRIDASVRNLEMMNWQPLWFDAEIVSSEGRYSKRISQRAVQNISSLGGAGAAAAIQRSALRLFETFGYARLGWSCKLRNSICEMDGLERAPTGYVIVKGGGIPAITVLGYNRQVDWQELVTRLKRVTAPESKPVVEK